MSQENQNENSQRTSRNEKLKAASKIAVKYIGTAAVTLAVAGGINHIAKQPDVDYSGEQEVNAGNGTNPTEMVRDNVDYDSNEVPTPEIVDYVVNLPENQDVMKDGLDAGETLIMPEKAERSD